MLHYEEYISTAHFSKKTPKAMDDEERGAWNMNGSGESACALFTLLLNARQLAERFVPPVSVALDFGNESDLF